LGLRQPIRVVLVIIAVVNDRLLEVVIRILADLGKGSRGAEWRSDRHGVASGVG
jgi:hypothetical protein